MDVRVDALALAQARRDVAAALREWGLTDAAAIHEALIVVSELIGNAIRYGGALVAVELDRQVDGVLVSVLDSSPSLPQQREAGADDENGRGLRLVSAYSEAWGAEPRVGGKRVWALIRLPH